MKKQIRKHLGKIMRIARKLKEEEEPKAVMKLALELEKEADKIYDKAVYEEAIQLEQEDLMI